MNVTRVLFVLPSGSKVRARTNFRYVLIGDWEELGAEVQYRSHEKDRLYGHLARRRHERLLSAAVGNPVAKCQFYIGDTWTGDLEFGYDV